MAPCVLGASIFINFDFFETVSGERLATFFECCFNFQYNSQHQFILECTRTRIKLPSFMLCNQDSDVFIKVLEESFKNISI
ncbi:hypothetical protein B9Z55_027879 [Caenorhabditis nigoni]|uniref:Uncharacterized protein n=1 Tax=Caenorhabditis nigoni TaxID=1611254 RepID=A0A2G5SDV2_9PELO|nr:hypothetical protein B9Z55_027879 [Caenorhabditis nigoni]